MKEQTTLSVIVPAYNCSPFLERAVNSAYNLCANDIEVIVVDDGSTDDTPAKCRQLLERYPALRVIRQPNGGSSAARNTGVDAATGEFIYFLDADDEILKFNLEVIAQSNADVLRIGFEDVEIDGSVTLWQESREQMTGGAYLHERLINGGLRVEPWAYVFRRTYLKHNNLRFPEGLLVEDTQFTVEALLLAQKFLATPTLTYRYIRRPGSIMGQQSFQVSRRRIGSYAAIQRRMMEHCNRHASVDLWLWAEHLVNLGWRYANREQSRRLAFEVLKMEWRLFTGYRLWGHYRQPHEVRYRLRLALERLLAGPREAEVG